MSCRHNFLITLIAIGSTHVARAADKVKYDFDQNVVVDLARENTDSSVAEAVAEAKSLIARPGASGDHACMAARYRWVEALMSVKRYDAALDVIAAAFDRVPNATTHLDPLQRFRVRCLLSLGRNEEALGHAKIYYNLCQMQNSSAAMELIVECLRAARPDRPDLVKKFIEEQVAGAVVTREAPLKRTSVLDGIKIPEDVRRRASDKADARRDVPPHRVESRLTLGNYLLMADRTVEAREVFLETYPLIEDGFWFKDATEAVARALKAEDGAVGRANAWVLAQR